MKYLILISLCAAVAVHAQTVMPNNGAVPNSTTPQGAGTTLGSPSTVGAGNFTSPATSINTGATPANPTPTFGAQTPSSPAVPSGIPNDTNVTNTPSNNPIEPQAQQEPLNFSTLPNTSTIPPAGTGTNPAGPTEPFPATTP